MEDIPVGILLAQELLKQHARVHLTGVLLKKTNLLSDLILFLSLVKDLFGLVRVQVVGDDAGQVSDQLPLLCQERAFIQLGKFLKVEDLDGTKAIVDGIELLLHAPLSLPESFALIRFSLKPYTRHGHLGILPGLGKNLGNLDKNLLHRPVLLDNLGGLVDAGELLKPLLTFGNQALNILLGSGNSAHFVRSL